MTLGALFHLFSGKFHNNLPKLPNINNEEKYTIVKLIDKKGGFQYLKDCFIT